MLKYVIASCLITVMAASIAVIDRGSADLAGSSKFSANAFQTADRIYATGIVEGTTEDINLRSELSGQVMAVRVSTGDSVEAGAVLVQLDDRQHRQQVAVSEANVKLAEAQLERLIDGARQEERDEARALQQAKQAGLDQALRTWKRIRQLREQNAIAQQEADDQQGTVETLTAEVQAAKSHLEQLEAPARGDEVRVAEARVASARADRELAKIALDKTRILAPRRGQILDVNVVAGEFVGPITNEPAVVLSDTSKRRVRAYVEEIDAPRIALDMPVTVTADGLPGHEFRGRVVQMTPRMARKLFHNDRPEELYDTKVREVVAELDNAPALILGLRVDVMFHPSPLRPAVEHADGPESSVSQTERMQIPVATAAGP
jgi:multidrug resistance efflux pump